jgi:magnesium-transporting ATPase (P-type)
MEGSAYGIVYATGDNTLIGCIARMTAAPKIGNYLYIFLIILR